MSGDQVGSQAALSGIPTVSVLMPVYNGASYLRQAVESILAQTFCDFEFVIVDDGSTDETAQILNSYTDPRIVRLTHATNQGVVAALNHGLQQVRGDYVARMDADDMSLPERIQRQVVFLQQNPQIGIVGAHRYWIDAQGQVAEQIQQLPVAPALVHWQLYFHFCVPHPSVMVRRTIYARLGGYDPAFQWGEDYELWLRALRITQIANLPEPLLYYRMHQHTVGQIHRQAQQMACMKALQQAYVALLGKAVPFEQARTLYNYYRLTNAQDVQLQAELLGQLYRAYTTQYPLTAAERSQIRQDLWLRWGRLVRKGYLTPALLLRYVRLAILLSTESPSEAGANLLAFVGRKCQHWYRQFWLVIAHKGHGKLRRYSRLRRHLL